MSQDVELARHDERLKIVEAGVSNFRVFQVEAREFFSEYRAVRKEREEAEKEALKETAARELKLAARRREERSNRIAVISIIAVILLPPAGWLGAKTTKYVGDIYLMLQEWESVHKSEVPVKTSSVDAMNQQNAGGTMTPAY